MMHSVHVCIYVYVHSNYLWNTCGKGHFQLSFTMSVSLICVLIFIPPGTTIAQTLIWRPWTFAIATLILFPLQY